MITGRHRFRSTLCMTTSAFGLAMAAPAAAEQPEIPKPPELPSVPELPQAPAMPEVPDMPSTPTDLASAADVALAAIPAEVKKLIPSPDDLADWFQGHGGAILGTGTMVVAPLGYVAGGDANSFYRSHLPGLGLHGQIGMLFLRRFGVVAHGGYAKHLKGTDGDSAGSSWQIGAGGLLMLLPQKKTPYLELGINRNSFSSDVGTPAGTASRTAASWDYRAGIGYMVLTEAQKFLYTPWLAVDFGRFSSVDQSLNGADSTLEFADDQRAWHYVVSAGITFAYHKKVPQLMGPPPKTRPDDADADLILDPSDRCRTRKEDYYPADPKDGCPSEDWDQDQVQNKADKCPTVPEDGLSPLAKDGCPTTDRDQDGVVDAADECRTLREDGQGDKPADGCPHSDRDGDGILDAKDKCVEQPETQNGFEDDDGCPDEAPRVAVTEQAIVIRERIFFEAGKSEVSDVSRAIIGEIAKVLKENPQIELVEIQGHADDRGDPNANRRITQERAAAVRAAVIERGVEPVRITAVGYGEYCPLEPNAPDRGGNEKNRRVEFRVLRTAKGLSGAETACAEAIRKGINGTDPRSKGPAR